MAASRSVTIDAMGCPSRVGLRFLAPPVELSPAHKRPSLLTTSVPGPASWAETLASVLSNRGVRGHAREDAVGVTASEELRALVNGFRVSQAVHVAAVLRISDVLADGPVGVEAVARSV